MAEGHKVKNPNMKLAEALRGVPAKLKVIISGTPIQVCRLRRSTNHSMHSWFVGVRQKPFLPRQNNLLEMHALFDYCCHGLLGSRQSFSR